ncbi:MAG: L-seryl-tRNA(Sec) selenium transferase, partial [Gammaproteobacteria bacterium]
RSQDDIRALAERLRAPFAAALGAHADVSVAPCLSQIGSGALPVEQLPSAALVLRPRRRSGRAPERLAAAFRALPLPVVGRVADGALLLDLRCLEDATALLEQLPHLALPETAR